MLKEGVRALVHTRLRLSMARNPLPAAAGVLRLVSGLALTSAYLLTAASSPIPSASAAGACTGWNSTVTPPDAIRVFRTNGPATGMVQTVPFRDYVATVMAAEWGVGGEAGRVGAVAVKQYAWYWTTIWRGKRAPASGACYDVADTTVDQVYRPEDKAVTAAQQEAIDATWSVTLRKGGRFFDTGYRSGTPGACGVDADGWTLYQASLYRCAREGMSFDQMLHLYLDPGLEIVRPGLGDSTGDGLGDVAVVTPGGDFTNVRLYSAGKVTPPGNVATTALGVPVALPLPPIQTIFRHVADVTGDHLDDMLILQRVGDGHYQIWVAASVGDGFGPPQLWWESALSNIAFVPGALVRFVTGDFTGDGRADAGLLVAGTASVEVLEPSPTETPTPSPSPSPSETPIATAIVGGPVTATDPNASPSASASLDPGASASPSATAAPSEAPSPAPPGVPSTTTLWVLAGSDVGLGPATPIWSGPLDLTGTTLFAGDVDNDGRADLVIQVDLTRQAAPGTGVRYAVVRTGAPNGSAPEAWLDIPDLAASGVKAALADVDRDGRADMVIDRAIGTAGSRLTGLLSTGSAFTQRTLWTNTSSFRWAYSRLAAADVNGDGRGDIVVLYNAGTAGSRLYRFISTGSSLKSAGSTIDPTLPWQGAAPY